MDNQKKEEKRKRRIQASIRMFVIGFLMATILFAGFFILTGRVLSKSEYQYFKEYREEYGKYYDLMDFIDEKALSEYKGTRLDDSIYRGIIESLDDPYAEYYTPDEYQSFVKRFAESYVGIGITIGDAENGPLIHSVMEDGPAAEAGLLAGDLIVTIDGEKVKDSTDATNKIVGDVGTDIKVKVNRNGKNKTFTVTRQEITEKSVKYTKLDKAKKIGYIQIAMFKDGTCKEFKNAVKDLKNDGYNKIVIDLRDNGGGSTIEAYDISDYLLPEGNIVTIVDNKGKKTPLDSDASTAGIEYVLLVNGNTASASEIVACAVQDNKGGKIIGAKTFGKGVTQMTHMFADGSVVKLTIEEYLRPSGDKVNKVGITPDILVDDPSNNDVMYAEAIKALTK